MYVIIVVYKVNCKNSAFTSNYHSLSCKYDLSHSGIQTLATYLARFNSDVNKKQNVVLLELL